MTTLLSLVMSGNEKVLYTGIANYVEYLVLKIFPCVQECIHGAEDGDKSADIQAWLPYHH